MARRQRPLLKGVPREWRGMYTAGGAGRNIATAYKDFWNMFLDTYPPASPYPSERGDSRWRSVGLLLWLLNVDANGMRQRPLLKGVPRQWRGMYTAGGASRNISAAYKDFWYLFWDTYPPASPYPSERGDSRWRSVCRHVVEDRQIWDYGTSKNTKKELVTIGDYSVGNRCLLLGWMIMT